MRRIEIDRHGGPDVLVWREQPDPVAGPGEVLVRHTAVGLNYIDTYHRSGLYPLRLPTGLGMEAAGVVTALGEGVTEVAVGDRVVYCSAPPGAYAEQRTLAATQAVRIPPEVDDRSAAAAMLKGLTAWYLLHRSYAVHPGDTVLSHAAAGGVGLILGQWAASLGVRVIGVTGSAAKARLARAHGCAEVVLADDPNFVSRVRDLTGGQGVAAVYDAVGRDTFMQSLDCLRRHGTMVSYGNASGPVDPFPLLELSRRGSLSLTRPVLLDFIATRPELEAATAALFAVMASGAVKIHIGQTYPLGEVARAHRDLEARRTIGSTVLLP